MPNSVFSEHDHQCMTLALSLAANGQYSTTPNPAVGCVIVNQHGEIVGRGYHQRAGEAHAEVHALKQAGQQAQNGTAYVTLEPCSHHGKTPPCAQALISAKLARVVIASIDHNPLVNNQGVEQLKMAGIKVDVGLLAEQADHLNRAFFYRMKHKKPWVCVKLAASIDGKTALHNGQSKWITSELSRADVQEHRARFCAILTGVDTVIADDPKLNVRAHLLDKEVAQKFAKRQAQPLRVVIDSKNRLSDTFGLFNDGFPVLVFNHQVNTKLNTPNTTQIQLPRSKNNAYIDLNTVMHHLASLDINAVWVEAGPTLTGALFDSHCVNQLILYQAPKLLGQEARPLINSKRLDDLSDASDLKLEQMVTIGNDIRMSYLVGDL